MNTPLVVDISTPAKGEYAKIQLWHTFVKKIQNSSNSFTTLHYLTSITLYQL